MREGFCCSPPRLASDRSRSASTWGGLRGIGPALAEEALGRMRLSRCARGVFGVRLQGSLRTDPAPLGVFWRSAGPVLRSQGTWGQAGLSRWRARGNRVRTFLCLLWTGPAPLQVFGGAPRDRSCARRERGGQAGLSRWRARGDGGVWPVGLGSLRYPFWRGGSGEASLGFQLPDQGFAGGEDAFVGGDGVGHGAELVSQTIAGAGGLQDANQRVHGEVDGEEQAAALR